MSRHHPWNEASVTGRRGRAGLYWLVTMAVATTATAGVLAYQTRKFFVGMETARKQSVVLGQANQALRTQLHTLEDQRSTLQTTQHSLSADRENLLSQLKYLMEEKNKMLDERTQFEQTAKQAEEQQQELERELHPLAQAHRALEGDYERLLGDYHDLLKERDLLKSQTDKEARKFQERQLKEALAKERQARQAEAADLQKTRASAKTFEVRQAKLQTELEKLDGRFESLKEKYASLLSENTTLKHQNKQVPGEVTRLAQQHQRLLKETADMHYNLGVLFSKNKQYYHAVAEFEKVTELRPQDAEAHYNLGVIYAENLPNREKAMAHFRRYLELNPNAKDATWVKQYIASWQAWEAQDRLE